MDYSWDFFWVITPVTNQLANPMAHLSTRFDSDFCWTYGIGRLRADSNRFTAGFFGHNDNGSPTRGLSESSHGCKAHFPDFNMTCKGLHTQHFQTKPYISHHQEISHYSMVGFLSPWCQKWAANSTNSSTHSTQNRRQRLALRALSAPRLRGWASLERTSSRPWGCADGGRSSQLEMRLV